MLLLLLDLRFAQRSGYRRIAFLAALRSNHSMPKLTIRPETGESVSHDLVEETSSPFPSRKTKKDPTRTAIVAAVVLAFAAFLISMVVLALMKAPGL